MIPTIVYLCAATVFAVIGLRSAVSVTSRALRLAAALVWPAVLLAIVLDVTARRRQ